MKPVLYSNPQGKDVTHSSYSSRQTFKHCPRELYLTRVEGWWGKEKRAAPLFGTAVEKAVQAFEQNNRLPGKAVETFERLWHDVQATPDFAELIYTEQEGDWASLLRAGREMARLYEIRAPFLPLEQMLFQQVMRKKIFPGTELDILENKAIVDIISFPRWDHPLLPKLDEKPDGGQRGVIIDMKTGGKDLPVDLISLDPQLAEYAWMARIPDVGFLWFVKHGHTLKKGSRVTLLETTDGCPWYPGFELFVLSVVKPAKKKGVAEETEEDDNTESTGQLPVFIGMLDVLKEYESTLKGLRGKIRTATEQTFLAKAVADGKAVLTSSDKLTKQRMQFAVVRLSETDMDEAGRDAAQTTVEMVRAHNENYYPKLAGVRFPNEKCNFCSMRWICLNRPKERDENLSRKGEEWLDGKDMD